MSSCLFLENHASEEVGSVEVGLGKVDGVEREEMWVRQFVAALIHVSLYLKSCKRLELVMIISLCRHSEAKLPCLFSLDVVKGSASER